MRPHIQTTWDILELISVTYRIIFLHNKTLLIHITPTQVITTPSIIFNNLWTLDEAISVAVYQQDNNFMAIE